MPRTTITIDGPAGQFSAYHAQPDAPNGATIIVIQEIFGVNAVVRDIADGYAALGYDALAPDLFWRIEPGIDISDKTDAEWKIAFDLYSKFDVSGGVDDIAATIAVARSMGADKVGAVGYCLGGLLAFLSGCRTDVNASIGYYGVGIDGYTQEAAGLSRPVLLHIAEEDGFVSKVAQDAIKAALHANPCVTLYSYPALDHAFARVGGAHFDLDGATLANSRSTSFFADNLL